MDEISALVQVLELEGKGIKELGKAILFLSKGIAKGVEKADTRHKITRMQNILKTHYASLGTDSSMSLGHMEELTGGNYTIINVPTENREVLTHLFNDLKKRSIPFAELPDLEVGDNNIQLAIDGRDKDKVLGILAAYRDEFDREPGEITLEDYVNMNPEQLEQLAKEGYQIELRAEIVSRIQERNKDKSYRPIGINIESLIIDEKADKYLFRTPMSGKISAKDCYVFEVDKKDMIFLDGGKTAYTHIKTDEPMAVYSYDLKSREMSSGLIEVRGQTIAGLFAEVDKKTIDRSSRVAINNDKYFANFPKAKDEEEPYVEHPLPETKEPLPDREQLPDQAYPYLSLTDSQLLLREKKLDQIMERNRDAGYMPLSINIESLQLEEKEDGYIFRTPMAHQNEDGSNTFYKNCYAFEIDKKDMVLLDDNQTAFTHLKKGDEIPVFDYDRKENKISGYPLTLSAEELAERFAKVDDKTIDRVGQITPDQIEHFPQRNKKESDEQKKETEMPSKTVGTVEPRGKNQFQHFPQRGYSADYVSNLEKQLLQNSRRPHNKTEEKIQDVYQVEAFKSKNEEEYIAFDVTGFSKNCVADNQDSYIFKTENQENVENGVRCLQVAKSDTVFDRDKDILHVKIPKNGQSRMLEVDAGTGQSRALSKNNESLVPYLQKEAGRSSEQKLSELDKRLNHAMEQKRAKGPVI